MIDKVRLEVRLCSEGFQLASAEYFATRNVALYAQVSIGQRRPQKRVQCGSDLGRSW